jgi:hypothetical protein
MLVLRKSGYRDGEREVALDRDRELEVVLTPLRPQQRPARAPSSTPAPTPASTPKSAPPTKRGSDLRNPFDD